MSKDKAKYDATKITVLEGLQAVRKRPAMYIGDTSTRGMHHLVYEVVDNSIDEAMAGYCDKIEVCIHEDNSLSVIDNGRGIPVDIHKTQKKTAVEVVMTVLHAGGKFDSSSYKVSGGLHGVGVSVVNALSEWLEVEVKRDGKIHFQEYKAGKPQNKLKVIGKSKKVGTKITFKPDGEIFECEMIFSFDTLAKRLRELAFLNQGITIILKDERSGKEQEETFYYKGGLISFVEYLNKNKAALHKKVIYFMKEKDGIVAEIAMQYNASYKENIFTYANNINTPSGGTHLTGFKSALTRSLNQYCKGKKLLKDGMALTGDDVREGIMAVVSVKLANPQFEGQTKSKLGNSEVEGIVEGITNEALGGFLEETPSVGRKIAEKAIIASRARLAAKKARELTRRKSTLESGSLPGKLADCSERNAEITEVYLVEGDSAGGSAKQGRDRRFQAILPLKGKILNVEKARLEKILNNEEIRTMITAIGTGIGEEFNIEKLRYGKIILMCDADVDGSHIRTLMLTFFYRHMTELVEKGHIYIAQPPLYKIKKGKKEQYIETEEKLNDLLIDLALEGIDITDVKTKQKLAEKKVKTLLSALMELERYVHTIEKRDVKFSDYIMMRNKKTKKMPLFKVTIDREDTFLYNEEELAELIKETEKKKGKSLEVDDEISQAGVEESINLTEFYEAREIDKILTTIDDLNIDTADFGFSPKEENKERSTKKPLYIIKTEQEIVDITNLKQLLEHVRKLAKKGLTIQRYKGLGEMNPAQLWETTMDPEKRVLQQVTVEDAVAADEMFTVLMGDQVAPRRSFIEKHAHEVKNLDI